MERAGAFDCAHCLSVCHARGREEGEGGISPFSMSIKTTSAQKTRDNRRRGDARGGAVKWWGNPCKTVKMAPPPTCPKGVSTRVHHQLSRIHYISPSSAHTHNHGAHQQQLTHRIKKKAAAHHQRSTREANQQMEGGDDQTTTTEKKSRDDRHVGAHTEDARSATLQVSCHGEKSTPSRYRCHQDPPTPARQRTQDHS